MVTRAVTHRCAASGLWAGCHVAATRRSRAWGDAARWIELEGRPRFDAEGSFLGYEGVGRDVTESRRVADEMRASLALIDTLFQATPLPVVMKDRQRATLRLHRAYTEHCGLPPESLLGLRSADVLDAQAAARADADRAEMARTAPPLRVVSQARLHDSRLPNAVVHKAPLFDALGQMNGKVAVVFDVTDEKSAASALAAVKAPASP